MWERRGVTCETATFQEGGAVATGSVHAKSDIVGADTANVVTAAQVFNGDVMSYLLKS